MTFARFARFSLYGLGLLLLGLLVIAIYCYHNLPLIVVQHAKTYLQQYGVEDLSVQQLDLSSLQLHTNELWLRGNYDGLIFEVTLKELELNYDWRSLLNGELESVTLADLKLDINNTAQVSNSPTAAVTINTLLPKTFLSALPVNVLTIEQWQLNYRAPDLSPVLVKGHLQLAEYLHLQLETIYLDSHLKANIISQLRDEQMGPELNAQFWLNSEKAELAELTAQFNQVAADKWQWHLQGKTQLGPILNWYRQLTTALQLPLLTDLTLVGQSQFEADINHPNSFNIPSTTELSSLTAFKIAISISNTIERLDYAELVDSIKGTLNVTAELSNERLKVTIDPTDLTGKLHTKQLPISAETEQWLGWSKSIPIHWQNLEPAEISTNQNDVWSLQLDNSVFTIGNKKSELRWEKINLNAQISNAASHFNTKFSSRLASRLHKQQLPQLKLTLDQHGPLDSSEFNLSVQDIAASMNMTLQGKVNLTKGQGQYNFSAHSLDLPYAVSSVIPALHKFGVLQQDITVNSGNMVLNSTVKSQTFYQDSWQQQSKLTIQNLSGRYDEYQFSGLAAAVIWSGIDQWQTKQPLQLTIDQLDAGFDIGNIQAAISLPKLTPIAQPLIQIEQFSADLFGGRVYLPKSQLWDTAADINHLTLRAEQWQLGDIIAMQQDQDIQANGTLEGALPITMTAGRMIIKEGYLHALPPGGNIRYIANQASRELAATSPELGRALDLLSDFRYKVLSSEVSLDKQGNLLLRLSLRGKNPAQFEGRPINFNINVEQNIDPLLQSLRLTDKLEKEIENRLR
jgi:hypothetical protein